jgi:hypothetical protein
MESRSADVLKLARDFKHPRDANIVFDEGPHTYTIDGVVAKLSVTGLIGMVESEHFDAPAVAERLSTSARPSEKYSRLDPETGRRVPLSAPEILGMWDAARDLGTDLHSKIERFLNDLPIVFPDGEAPNKKEFGQFLRWWEGQKALGFEAYRTEWVIYDDINLAGSIDFLMRNKHSGELSIVDWKRCITGNAGFSSAWKGRRMLPPLDHMEETKLNHWKVQVNVYRHILETRYDVKIRDMMMVVLYADQEEAVVYTHERDDSVEALILLNRK